MLTRLHWNPDGTRAVLPSGGMVRVWDVGTGESVAALNLYGRALDAGSFSPDGMRFVTSAPLGRTVIWDTRTWSEILELTNISGTVRSTAWSPDGSRVATASGTDTVRIWDAATGIDLLVLKAESAFGHGPMLSWSPDGRKLQLSREPSPGPDAGRLSIWDATPSEPRFRSGEVNPPRRETKQ